MEPLQLDTGNGFVFITRQENAGTAKAAIAGRQSGQQHTALSNIDITSLPSKLQRLHPALKTLQSTSCLVQRSCMNSVLAPPWFAEESIPALIPSETLIALHAGIKGLRTNITKLGDAGVFLSGNPALSYVQSSAWHST
jgi:hypothetical protein